MWNRKMVEEGKSVRIPEKQGTYCTKKRKRNCENVENDEKLTLIKLLYKKMPFLWHFFVLYLTCYDKRGCAIIDLDLLFVNIQTIWAITRF